MRLLQRVVRSATAMSIIDGDHWHEMVGESFHQEALERLAGGKREESASVDCHAALVREPRNPYDANAVRVVIGEADVGHLSRGDAIIVSPRLARWTHQMRRPRQDRRRLAARGLRRRHR